MVDLRDPRFFDQGDIEQELRRVFDVCHTCRMCFSYCPSFPSMFDAIDRHEEAGRGEVEALTQPEIDDVVDLCYQCKLCYVKCPYTPPHKFAVDFPRLLLRAKLARTRKNGVALRERVLARPETLGRLSSGPLAPITNWANRQKFLRALLEKALGIHRRRLLPQFARKTFRRWFASRRTRPVDGTRVALFETCSVNYNYPQVGIAAVQVLEHNEKNVVRPEVVCCGMPALDGGDLETATENVRRNVQALLPLVSQGTPVVVLAPTCSMMIKHEWPQLHPTEETRLVAANTYDVGEYLAKEKAAGRLKTEFAQPQGSVAYHIPCHLRAQNIGQPFRGILESIPGTQVQCIEQCSSFDGTWGMKTEFYDHSRKGAGKLCRAVCNAKADRFASDCMMAGLNVTEETGIAPVHPIEVLRDAYGLKE